MKKGKLIEFYLFVAIFIVGLVLIKNSIFISKDENSTSVVAAPKTNVNYEVYLKENSAIPDVTVGERKVYLAKYLDYIRLKYKVIYQNELKYNIKGKINVSYVGAESGVDPVLTSRNYEYCIDKVVKNIDENIDINYNEYLEQYVSIKDELGVPVTGILELEFVANDNSQGTKVASYKVNIPLDKEAFSIEVKDESPKVVVNKDIKKSGFEVDKTKLVLGAIITIVSAICAFKVADTALNKKHTNAYTIRLARILKNYGDIIAEMAEPIDLSQVKIADVKNFEQLVDVEEETRSPINFYEVKKNEIGHFVIIHNSIGYRYILRNREKR